VRERNPKHQTLNPKPSLPSDREREREIKRGGERERGREGERERETLNTKP
jgi:hypothetical protein